LAGVQKDLEMKVNKIENLYMNVEDWKKVNKEISELREYIDEHVKEIHTRSHNNANKIQGQIAELNAEKTLESPYYACGEPKDHNDDRNLMEVKHWRKTDSTPSKYCDNCELYGECDHQGTYKKDGKWCYEDDSKLLKLSYKEFLEKTKTDEKCPICKHYYFDHVGTGLEYMCYKEKPKEPPSDPSILEKKGLVKGMILPAKTYSIKEPPEDYVLSADGYCLNPKKLISDFLEDLLEQPSIYKKTYEKWEKILNAMS